MKTILKKITMEQNNNLQKSQASLEESTQRYKQILKQSIAVAFERTGTEPLNETQINSMVEDVFSEFTDLDEVKIKKAIRNGSLGMYGKTYKLTTQEICIWIRVYLEQNTFKAPWQ